jgi:hypothetical protein
MVTRGSGGEEEAENPMADPTVKLYDPESGKVTTIPVRKLSDSMDGGKEEGC